MNIIKEILDNPNNIRHFPNAPLRVQLLAVTLLPSSIRGIENPCETVQLAAVNVSGMAVDHIESPTKLVLEVAYIRIDEQLYEAYQSSDDDQSPQEVS